VSLIIEAIKVYYLNKKILATVFLVLIVVVGIYAARMFSASQNKYIIPLSDEEIENILTLHIIDETDEEATQVEDTPPEPVNYPPVNITKVSFGTDQGYLYIKFEFLGEIPVKKEDPVTKITVCILMDTDGNDSTGWCGYDALVGFYVFWGSLTDEQHIDAIMKYNVRSVTDEEEAFRTADQMPVEYKGGPGTNYVVLRVPMDILGLQSGQQIIVDIHAEAESKTYHHYAFDALRSSLYEYVGSGNYFWHSLQIPIP